MARFLSLLVVLLVAGCEAGGAADSRPNVLVIVMDTVRGDRCSINGYGRPTTPRLAEIAREGVTFTNAWSASPWTGPSHATFFTGLRPEHHGYFFGNRMYLSSNVDTLAERLRAAGWRTACLTSNPMISHENGLTQGFEHHESILELAPDVYPTAGVLHGRGLEWVRKRRADGELWFLFVNHMEAHLPYTPPEEAQARFVEPGVSAEQVARARGFLPEDAPLELALGLREVSVEQWRVMSDLYDAEIAALDAEIGKFLDTLRGEDLLRDTIVVVLSDHGENLGDHGLASHLFSLHRTVLHVPLIVVYPARLTGGRSVGDVVRLEDVFPTVLDLAGVEIPAEIDGESLAGPTEGRRARAVFGRPEIDLGDAAVPEERVRRLRNPIRSVFDGRRHLIRWFEGREEAYDVLSDPGETRNLAGRERAAFRPLAEWLPEF